MHVHLRFTRSAAGIHLALVRSPRPPGYPYNGKSFLSAGFIVALMITPVITSITRDVFDTAPRGQKEAAPAVGATVSRSTRKQG